MNLAKNYMNHISKIKAETRKQVNPLLDAMYKNTSKGYTENGAVTFTRSGSNLLDFYAQAGSMRGNPERALELFQKAFSEDNLNAIKILFYLRDVRGGQGERTLFRVCLEWLGTERPEVFEQIVKHVPEYGRWDDLLFDNAECISLINKQISKDLSCVSEEVSLLAKWLPTMNASSPTTKAKAKWLAEKLGLKEVDYRRKIRDIRKKIKTVEEKMSAQKWGDINYSSVPSQASRIYRNAFRKHDETRYNEFVDKATTGEVKINAGTLYPYQIYKSVQSDYSATLEALWTQLPDYTLGKNALVVADVSGSMSGDPMAVSVSLALYFAERNKGAFKDYFITFSSQPKLQRVVGSNLRERMRSIETAEWQQNTNIQAVFELILTSAVQNRLKQEDLPETLYIISDMEFDQCCDRGTNFEVAKTRFETFGYKIPNVVFWNVDARSGSNLPVQKNEKGVALVSGFSPVVFKMAVENKTPEQVMMDTINAERYAQISLSNK